MYKAYAKVNIFLKIVGKRDNYHELLSRFILVKNLFDELEFVEKKTDDAFELHGEFGCELKSNTIYKAYDATCKAGFEKQLKEFFTCKALSVKKNIPSFAGLGGGSSDAAIFLHMINKEVNLNLSNEELANIGLSVGADVPFFVYGYNSANVSGIGEVVKEFKEEPLHVKTMTPNIKCDTGAVYRAFRQDYKVDVDLATKMSKMSSQELLNTYDDITLNDLFGASLSVYKELEEYRKKDWYFSGSGSSFFTVEND
ncbi:4-(cytidine 5'-diphospho)-2-C-methyl-D-erythritol kinase [Sulfurospirillum arcachonense]|uniref:4-(cytidine 5'-diphospho)-2-C-methyl-D-erythritol kinase n=1 Tax=Sulfurospirillum arcachonense TaxID=57666 RepID=UPI0004BB1059|nr:4-(cytidine 5'-diphospho)-2-C-methyl-D-erythritol kinase [Sulfurospirillum arcachonense]